MIKLKNEYFVIGLMSGTSMDGLDLSFSKYIYENDMWSFELIDSKTFKYDQIIKKTFIDAFDKKISINKADTIFTNLLVDAISEFIRNQYLKVDLISSHGHTIFHEPAKSFTTQIGNGSLMSKALKLPVVCNFRQQDIDLGGEGAPLVPIGDKMLFHKYDICINLGGIANISYDRNGERIGYDICPCNLLLNHVANKINKEFDQDGLIAKSGKINYALLNKLNQVDYYKLAYPKSLGKEMVDKLFISIINNFDIKIEDQLATLVEHIAKNISQEINILSFKNCLITGGGALNDFLVSKIKRLTHLKIIIPSNDIINYKESIVFGFLGLLRMLNKKNCLSSYTGASKDHSSGDLYVTKC